MVACPAPARAVAAVVLIALGALPAHATRAARSAEPAAGEWALSTTDPAAAAAAPAYVGNGYVGTRIPADGAGYVSGPVATGTHIAGVYAAVPDRVHGGHQPQGSVSLPGWTRLDVVVAGRAYTAAAARDYRQSLDLRRGVVTTTATWSVGGRVTDLAYDVVVDRARMRVGLVRLRFTPRWSGTVEVRDVLGGGADPTLRRVRPTAGPAETTLTARTAGTGITVAQASRLRAPASSAVVAVADATSVTRTATIAVRAGASYEVAKVVGFATSLDARDPLAAARAAAAEAPATGQALAESAAAWQRLWAADIQLPGQPQLQRRVRAAKFYLLASVRAGVRWSVSPVGLSGSGYNNHVFWDAETWIYPALLAQHPDEAGSVVDYRHRTLAGARRNARRTGYAGTRFAWESALTGDEVTPAWAETGELEQHITADVALAQWQHYLATGDGHRLRARGWPVIEGAARFWASRAQRRRDGWHIPRVQGPDEQNWPVDDSTYTNATAAMTLRIAARTAAIVGVRPPARWSQVADGLMVHRPVPMGGHRFVRPEFRGYAGQRVKQADVVLLTYPWEYPQPAAVDRDNLRYYAARYDPDGPAMTDSVNSVVAARLGDDCSAWTYTRRSVDPFVRGPYEQFTEARAGQGVFTFLTGEGGFLQEFLYGYPGLRWRAGGPYLDPMLPPQLAGGLRVTGVRWHGRILDIDVGARTTTVTLRVGGAMPVGTPAGRRTLAVGTPVTLPTRTQAGSVRDAARCRPVTASAADPSGPPEAAVDGSPVTAWTAGAEPAEPGTLTVALGATTAIGAVTAAWSGARPLATYTVQARRDGGAWRTIATVPSSAALVDRIRVGGFAADEVRLLLPATRSGGQAPALAELTVVRS
ncbi:discoidin domain-containing protein [Luedemannella helvata]|uniref:F5/8 type C domain-containing protein n=1 Tax=Luedemannella helvata TaxID=349315 RepID=A0ABP4X4V3_9ACTN